LLSIRVHAKSSELFRVMEIGGYLGAEDLIRLLIIKICLENSLLWFKSMGGPASDWMMES